jgi:hypothetical protein
MEPSKKWCLLILFLGLYSTIAKLDHHNMRWLWGESEKSCGKSHNLFGVEMKRACQKWSDQTLIEWFLGGLWIRKFITTLIKFKNNEFLIDWCGTSGFPSQTNRLSYIMKKCKNRHNCSSRGRTEVQSPWPCGSRRHRSFCPQGEFHECKRALFNSCNIFRA